MVYQGLELTNISLPVGSYKKDRSRLDNNEHLTPPGAAVDLKKEICEGLH